MKTDGIDIDRIYKTKAYDVLEESDLTPEQKGGVKSE